jgi:hypothetical protein
MRLKKGIAYIVSWTLYYIGDIIAHLMHIKHFEWLYSQYSWCMRWSVKIQDWAHNKSPWKKVN